MQKPMLKEGSDTEDFPSGKFLLKKQKWRKGQSTQVCTQSIPQACIHWTQSITTKPFNSSCDVNAPKLQGVCRVC